MAHYAKVNDGIVIDVIVAEAEFFDTFVDDTPGEWVQTSYNTRGGVHSDGGTPLRKNYAVISGIYDSVRDAFYRPQPYPSWTLNETTCMYEAPTDYPSDDKFYEWDEDTTNWVEVT